ncbi:FGGY-family carbohydrate kinase [Ahrensia kielensis]|uniref:FGGY-family carbohydrate kinase n=1 Tax=Ahrensia kielensis TaxID=76980 RepID=UPI00036CF921
MMTNFIAVIDIGKTNAKVAIVDKENWSEIAVRTTPNSVLNKAPYPHFDIEGLWKFIVQSLRALNDSHPISAISITTHGASAVLLDNDGQLALPMLDYEHDGPDTTKPTYQKIRPNFAETGSPELPLGLNLGAQLFWQQTLFAKEFSQVQSIVTYPQYWAFRLTGVLATEVTSLGCHTDLWNPWENKLSSLCTLTGWGKLLAPIRKANDILGTITPKIASETGISANVPVYCGIHDSNASLYPNLRQRKGPFSVVSSGTWVICMAIEGNNIKPDPARDTLVNVSAFGDAVPSARFMGGREYDLLLQGQTADCSNNDIATVLEKKIYLLPAAENRSGPFQGYGQKWLGDEPADGVRYAAISFYLAMMTSVCLNLIGAQGPIIVEGPFSRNRPFLDMLSAATQGPVIAASKSATGTSIGAAMLSADDSAIAKLNSATSEQEIDCTKSNHLNSYADSWHEAVRNMKRKPSSTFT